MKYTDQKREEEKKVAAQMIRLYCRKRHRQPELCEECHRILTYAMERCDRCPFMERKTFCSNCKVHCYQPEMRKKIREIMRFSGPWMLLYHPVMAAAHMITTVKERVKRS